jgi:hypothetical protein
VHCSLEHSFTSFTLLSPCVLDIPRPRGALPSTLLLVSHSRSYLRPLSTTSFLLKLPRRHLDVPRDPTEASCKSPLSWVYKVGELRTAANVDKRGVSDHSNVATSRHDEKATNFEREPREDHRSASSCWKGLAADRLL